MNEQKLINLIGEIGRLLLKHGAEIYRVEESLLRMCKSYGYENVEVFALPSYFTLTIEMHDNHTYTLSKRTQQNRVNLDMIYELNNLVRYVCDKHPDYDCLKNKFDAIKNTPLNMPLIFLGYGLGTGFFTTFFGGHVRETIVAIKENPILAIKALKHSINRCNIYWFYFILFYLVNGNIGN